MERLEKLFPLLCALASLGIMAWYGYDQWTLNNRAAASFCWLMMLPMASLLGCLMWLQQTIDSRHPDDKQPDSKPTNERIKQHA